MCRFHAFFLKWKTNCNFGFEACGIIRTISQLEDGNLICNISRCLVVAMMCFFASTNTCIYIYSISSAFDYGERNRCWTNVKHFVFALGSFGSSRVFRICFGSHSTDTYIHRHPYWLFVAWKSYCLYLLIYLVHFPFSPSFYWLVLFASWSKY